MKQILTILLLTLFFSAKSQIKVNLYFINNCSDSILRLDYELFNPNTEQFYESKGVKAIVPSFGKYMLSTGIINGDLIGYFYTSLIINDSLIIDTFEIPKILFTCETALHSQYWNYYNCWKICHGLETDTYANGKIWHKGIFENGKPSEISEYRIDGSISIREFYVLGFQEYKRIEYFDSNGALDTHEIFKNKKKKTIILTYDRNDKLIDKKIQKKLIVKHN
jgi:hypothetical protein